jgi:RNA polymerase sigma-70 factor (ECF subfamily)
VQQIGQEVKALTNMLVGIPGGVAGVGMDIGSRISSLAIGEGAKAAGVRARQTAEHTNALWGKVTGALGLTQDASGSNIERLLTKGIEATDVGGAKLEQATGGVITKETAQSVRDTLLNALGVKGLGVKGIVKGKAPKPGEGTMGALTADQAIRDSKARVAAKAVEDAAAGTARAETVQKVYEQATKNKHPLDEAWAGKAPKETAGSSPAWDTMVVGLVEPPRMPEPPVPQGPGVTPKTRVAEPTIIGQAPDMTVSGFDKLRRGLLLSKAEADAIRSLGRGTPEVAVEGVAPPRATLAERMAEPLPARGPGTVPKTRLEEGTVLGKEAPPTVAELHGITERLIDTGVAKLQRGELISKAEANAIRALKPLAGQEAIVGPSGKPYFQRGAVDPTLLKVLGLMGLGAVAGTALYNWFQSPSGLSGDNARDAAMGLGAAGAAGVMKGKGGMWHDLAAQALAKPLMNRMKMSAEDIGWGSAAEKAIPSSVEGQWATKAVSNYLNKHAGTATDPIKDLRLPSGAKWEDLTDQALGSRPAGDYAAKGSQGAMPGLTKLIKEGKVKPDEPVYKIGGDIFPKQFGHQGEAVGQSVAEMKTYLAHVGDYLKSRNLTPEQLQQMDLPRAIRETVANDQRVAAEALKDFTKPNPVRMADTQTLPEYKSYPPVEQGPRKFSFNKDGSIRKMDEIDLPAGEVQYSWREIVRPKELTPSQMDRIRRATDEEIREVAAADSSLDVYELLDEGLLVATDAKGNVIRDNFSKAPAAGSGSLDAHLAGQLAQEGNALGHCVGGYVEQVLLGESRIMSLRDQNGRSYATIELTPSVAIPRSWQGLKQVFKPGEDIAQIKGPGNGAPPKYVEPYVQDFVKSGKWGEVKDLQNTGLRKWNERYLSKEDIDGLTEAEGEAFAGRNLERGKADPRLLAGIAMGTAAGVYAYNNPPDQLAGLAAGLLGATVIRKAPTAFDKMPTSGLIEAMKAGGAQAEGAARAIHDSTRGQLERSLWSYKDTIDIEGVVQEAYAKTFAAMASGEFRGDAKPSTFLHSVAQNLAKNASRDRKATPDATSSSSVMSPDGEPVDIAETLTSEGMRTPEQQLQNQQMAKKMQDSLDKLPEDQRTAFTMAEIEGMPYEEIAAQLDVPIGTVRSRIGRARESLKASLKDYTPQRQSGKVDQTLLKVGGMVGGGAIIGGALADDASKGAVTGAIMGLMASALGTKPMDAALMRGTTRIAEVAAYLRRAWRDSEHQASVEVSAASDAISGFVKPVKKLSAEAQVKLDEAYANADPAGVQAALAESPEAMLGYQKLRKFLDSTGDRLKAFGRFKEGVPDYLPLLVKDYKGLMDHLGLETRTGLEKYLHNANTKAIKETGNALSEVEKSLLVNDYLLRDPATSYLPGFAKHRRLKMTPETRPFYHSMDDALIHYAHAAVEDIAEAKFFGKDLRTSKVGGQQYTNLDNSIGALTARAIEEGRMTPEQAIEVQAVLRARYGKGKLAPSGWLQDVRNVSGAALLGQLGSGLVQTSEGLLSTYHHGIRPAIEAVGIQVTGRGIKPAEFGLANHVIEEVIGKRATGQALSTLLKVNLLATFDQMGMGQNLTASFVKNKRLAETPRGQAELARKWGADYGPDMPQLIKELQASTTKSRTPLVDSLLYQELSDVRPTSRAEAPELYNLHPNARLMYHLKQFMLTQADVLYRDAYSNIKTGEPKKVALGLKNLALYAAALSTVTIPSDAIKNWMMGRGLKLDKIDYVDNFVRNFGLSRYTINKVANSETPGKEIVAAGVKALTPPAASVASTAFEGLSKPEKLVPLIPLVGRTIYNRELGGNEAALRAEQLQKRLDLRDAREARNPQLKAARLRKQAAAKKAAAAKFQK